MLGYDELLNQREDLAETIRALRDVVTHDAETKADFIARVRAILADGPDTKLHCLGCTGKPLPRL